LARSFDRSVPSSATATIGASRWQQQDARAPWGSGDSVRGSLQQGFSADAQQLGFASSARFGPQQQFPP
jgi:hypothetical protein